ncbi:nucleotide-binding protein [Philodulcilactobacillus myokoensis]|uniref:Nucleotide-binding protein n=1 Tax=Philodulcilactobacillus myokoensis TaxID=2929573 RepID=A0A9W6B1W4_9LACO|nr:RNase adapter RapZ [Philodulcilactobacillus myokoensis]GLB47133.1 nucleotide-binding protein [Philodulcilactobacillus myokoensis]
MKLKGQLVIITGMSGAGKTIAIQSFEDLGYFCTDNMPPSLLPQFVKLINSSRDITKVALVIDLRSKVIYRQIVKMLDDLSNQNRAEVIFLDASNEELITRYKESRRSHPLSRQHRLLSGIKKERALLRNVKASSQVVIDTTHLSLNQLRQRLLSHFSSGSDSFFHIEILSFGFKYGLPMDADIVMDVRFLPNPYYIKSMRNQTGLDQDVYDYVMNQKQTANFYHHFLALLRNTLPGYQKEGKTNLTIAIGCTGGQHRSVAIAERLYQSLKPDYSVHVTNRDIRKKSRKV